MPTNGGLGYITSFLLSAMALATSFEWITWTQDQQNNVLTFAGLVGVGLFALNTHFGRAKKIREAAQAAQRTGAVKDSGVGAGSGD